MMKHRVIFLVALALMVLPGTAAAYRWTPSAGLRIASIEVYPNANMAAVRFAGRTIHKGGRTECMAPIAVEDYNEYSRVGIDLRTEGGRAALSVAMAAFQAGRPLYVETSDVCLSEIGLFAWSFGATQ
ncbi:hypothetical protein WME76_07000 [Sorangium sp. So ce119]|uniref:hypothetical protein n=1 Tax=Sorangium sp. So ce119 TaxID=3133279 RepID=UPI003F60F410